MRERRGGPVWLCAHAPYDERKADEFGCYVDFGIHIAIGILAGAHGVSPGGADVTAATGVDTRMTRDACSVQP